MELYTVGTDKEDAKDRLLFYTPLEALMWAREQGFDIDSLKVYEVTVRPDWGAMTEYPV